jgi:hypothetical protein
MVPALVVVRGLRANPSGLSLQRAPIAKSKISSVIASGKNWRDGHWKYVSLPQNFAGRTRNVALKSRYERSVSVLIDLLVGTWWGLLYFTDSQKSGPYPTPGTPEFTNASIAQSNTFLRLDRCQLLWFEHQE